MAITPTIGGITYRYQKDLHDDAASRFPKGSRDWREWTPDEWWCDLLQYSPSLQDKIDDDLDGHFEGFLHQVTNANHLCLKGKGNRIASFGWGECVKGAFGKSSIPADPTSAWLKRAKRGMRSLIVDQVVAAKCKVTLAGQIRCELTGDWLPTADVHADHHPDPFDAIANTFLFEILKELGETADLVKASASSGMADHFVDHSLNERWQAFHAQHASYRMINATANMKKGRGYP